ncbi:GNAT family N-acetyltransferase [Pelagicoccus mobilis]|uniref:GNAT family N-acetyltransferase n=1 Tax=Pelagicoccus mobilis TaxID=415221 RepID=A0A934RWD7_9BACT|nr:GNAT family N-acetyltransferase [Pelagicoccus mobilis]MBK1876705.1 GNAT family N-acetyltransferase [Pelagicoccus mobilis]
MPVTIRRATPEDAAIIAEFNIAMALETEGKVLAPATIRKGVHSLFEHPELGFYLVAELDGKIAASLMITTEWSDWRNGLFWWIQSVYVVPEARRQGLFTQLYRYVESLAADDSRICGFRLYVERENKGAQAVYRSLGMNETHYKLFETERNQ